MAPMSWMKLRYVQIKRLTNTYLEVHALVLYTYGKALETGGLMLKDNRSIKNGKAITVVMTFRPKFDRHARVSTYLCPTKL